MFNKLKLKREAKLEQRYLLLKEKLDRGASFSDNLFNKFIDLEIKYNSIQQRKRSNLNVISIEDSNT